MHISQLSQDPSELDIHAYSLVLYIQKDMPCHFALLSDLLLLFCSAECLDWSIFQPKFEAVCFIHILRNLKGFCVLKVFTCSETIDPAYKTEGTKTRVRCDLLRTQTISLRPTPQGYMKLSLNQPPGDLEGLVKYLI